MAFFDKLGETISAKSKDVAKKTKELAEVSSLNYQITSQEDVIRDTYLEIGRAYFEANRENLDAPYLELGDKILAAQAVIEEKKQKIREIKGIKLCTNCNAEIPLNAAFCANCGSKVEVPVALAPAAEESQTVPHCPVCNAELPPDSAFCTSCGHKIEQ